MLEIIIVSSFDLYNISAIKPILRVEVRVTRWIRVEVRVTRWIRNDETCQSNSLCHAKRAYITQSQSTKSLTNGLELVL